MEVTKSLDEILSNYEKVATSLGEARQKLQQVKIETERCKEALLQELNVGKKGAKHDRTPRKYGK